MQFAAILLLAAAADPTPQPGPKPATQDSDWQPVPKPGPFPDYPATAFPEIKPPMMTFKTINGETRADLEVYDATLRKLCPRLLGSMTREPTEAIKLTPGDDLRIQLLKAQLH